MDRMYTRTNGNLALSSNQQLDNPVYQTKIYTLPAKPVQRANHLRREHVQVISSAPAHYKPSASVHTPLAKHSTRRTSAISILRTIACTVMLAGLVFFAVSSLFSVLVHETQTFERAVETTERTTISVVPGDTLWSLALEHEIDELTTQQTVDAIRSWNDLGSSNLQPGMELEVPAATS